MLLVTAGRMKEGERFQENSAAVKFYGIRPGGKNLFLAVNTLPSLFEKGELPFHGMETCGVVVEHDDAPSPRPRIGVALASPPNPEAVIGGQEPAPAKAGAAVTT